MRWCSLWRVCTLETTSLVIHKQKHCIRRLSNIKRARCLTCLCDCVIHKLTKQYFMGDSTEDASVALDSKPVRYLGLPLRGAVGSFQDCFFNTSSLVMLKLCQCKHQPSLVNRLVLLILCTSAASRWRTFIGWSLWLIGASLQVKPRPSCLADLNKLYAEVLWTVLQSGQRHLCIQWTPDLIMSQCPRGILMQSLIYIQRCLCAITRM